jgi:hypothetical protein
VEIRLNAEARGIAGELLAKLGLLSEDAVA